MEASDFPARLGLKAGSTVEFQQVGDRGNDERSLLVNMSDVEMLTS